MAYSDYTGALDTLRTLMAADDWQGAREQLLVVRSRLVELPDVGLTSGDSLKFRVGELDRIESEIKGKLASNLNRFLHTRTNYATR